MSSCRSPRPAGTAGSPAPRGTRPVTGRSGRAPVRAPCAARRARARPLRACPRRRARSPRAGRRARRGCPSERLEGCDYDPLEDVEHLLACRERELEVELSELELAVRAEILVPPARRDLVVAVEPTDHEHLLEQLRRLGKREKGA